MVGVQVRVDGRAGLLLADPGYHVARVVTVMQDQAYPHTGWFTQSDEQSLKEYCYAFSPHSAAFVEWRERTTRDGAVKRQTSLVFAARPFLDGVNVTERRNLVYNFSADLQESAGARPKRPPDGGAVLPGGRARPRRALHAVLRLGRGEAEDQAQVQRLPGRRGDPGGAVGGDRAVQRPDALRARRAAARAAEAGARARAPALRGAAAGHQRGHLPHQPLTHATWRPRQDGRRPRSQLKPRFSFSFGSIYPLFFSSVDLLFLNFHLDDNL